MEAVGYSDDFENFTLCQSISACFQVFNVAPIILVNVLDPNKAAHVTQNQAESCDVVDGVVLYDKKYVLLNTLTVKNGSNLEINVVVTFKGTGTDTNTYTVSGTCYIA